MTRYADFLGNMNLCYILDGILILYGIILTVLYCRLRMQPSNYALANRPEKQPADGGIYAVRLLILMLKKTFKKAHEGHKVTAFRSADGFDLPQH
ncbi:high affinity immunoglobulin epsilon receptor subunit gamma-like isoform X1 [Acanthochromis polyacanthus]|uniref:high affinity immunoglobulin epsilon receptor subunit gamma-like isoform X1 n=1 Tax=Acanthochromis polyacanthus TaxID=80966 RepID=UPI002233EF76|nr:high affinity immunoglobulin epsilon receptor subunit gamma-like isoform X1 [Acanthochromis polyacanthus]